MLVIRKRYRGGSFGSFLSKLFAKAASSTVARQLASTAAKELGNVAIDAGKKLAEKSINKIFTPPVDMNNRMLEIANKHSASAANINSQIDGGSNAVAIQDLVRKLNNGSGLKFA